MINNNYPAKKAPISLRRAKANVACSGASSQPSSRATKTLASFLKAVILPGGKGSTLPLHRHQNSQESIFILDGKLECFPTATGVGIAGSLTANM